MVKIVNSTRNVWSLVFAEALMTLRLETLTQAR